MPVNGCQSFPDTGPRSNIFLVKISASFVPKLSKVLSAKQVLRYLQIENKIRAAVKYELAMAIPLVE